MENIIAISDSQMKQSLHILEKAEAVEHLEIGDEVIIRASGERGAVTQVVNGVVNGVITKGVWLKLSSGVTTFMDFRDVFLFRRPPKED